MKIKNFFGKMWTYVLVFALPLILLVVHALLRNTWPIFEGSLLFGDTGTLYIQMYTEFWEKIHGGESVLFSWSSGMGIEYGLGMLRYLMSPFSLLVLLVPKSFIPQMVQIIMVLKWSLLSVTMLYFVSHTKHNTLEHRKQFMCVLFSIVYGLSNVALQNLNDLSYCDVMIALPLLMLWTEKLARKEGSKFFGFLLALTFVMNCRMIIPISVFLIVWFVMQFDKDTAVSKFSVCSFAVSYGIAVLAAMVVVVPNVLGDVALNTVNQEGASVYELIHRFFVCDSLLRAQSHQPMLYCSVVAIMLSGLYVFSDASWKKKICTLLLVVFSLVGVLFPMDVFPWNNVLHITQSTQFLLIVLVIYMMMETLNRLESIKMWQIILVGIASIGCVVLCFFNTTIMLEFYVYLTTILLVVFTFMMLVFYRKNSIQYRNVLIVFAVIGILELSANAVIQLKEYNEYEFEKMFNHQSADILTKNLSVDPGEKVAIVQNSYNYGMCLQLPTMSWESRIGQERIHTLYKKLGMEWSEDAGAFHGGSPLLNAMFNVRYGLGQNEMMFSDCEKLKEATDGYALYEMQRLCGAGYMVKKDVSQWDMNLASPFLLQNDFVKKTTGEDGIFEIIQPKASCISVGGRDPLKNHENCDDHAPVEEQEPVEEHVHEEGETHEHADEAAEVYYGSYEGERYYYHFMKMFVDDYVNYSFKSDGVTDYYIYMQSPDKSITYLQINGEYVAWDQVASKQKTYHIGVLPEGYTISLISDFQLDDYSMSEVWYEVADFNEEQYAKVYDLLSQDVLEVTKQENGKLEGVIYADEEGMMMTNVPANSCISVKVDDEKVSYEVIGDALIGVPLEKGEHTILILYDMPYVTTGLLLLVFAVILYIVFWIVIVYIQRKNRKN